VRLRELRAIQAIAVLMRMPKGKHGTTGDDALKLTEEQATRIHARATRFEHSRGANAMSLSEIVHKSRQHARARITKPGKRRR
jgi:hypothetical protein